MSRPGTSQTQRSAAASVAASEPAPPPQPPPPGRRIDVNTATLEELQEVPGLTEEIASAILEARENGQLFEEPEQIAKVPMGIQGMIGKKKVSKWLPWLTAVKWHSSGSLRVGCWNLENLSDESTVEAAPNFDSDRWLNSFVNAVTKHCDLVTDEGSSSSAVSGCAVQLILLEVNTTECERLKVCMS